MTNSKFVKDSELAFRTVCETFHKTENEVTQDVEIITKWLQAQSHLPEIPGDSHIRNFLILNKFSIERTKRNIDMYYTIRSLIPDFFDDCNPKSQRMREIWKHSLGGVHPSLILGSCRATFCRLKGPNSLFLPVEAFLTLLNLLEMRLHEDCFYYDVYIADLSDFRFSEITKITPSFIKKVLIIFKKAFPVRLKAVYCINAPSYFSHAMAVFKAVTKPKLFERIHVHENDEILKALFTIDTLPRDYGGYGPSFQELTDTLVKTFGEYRDRFDRLDKMRPDENARPAKLDDDEMLGYYGNFKKLAID